MSTNSAQFFQRVFQQGVLPERSVDSMKNFYKRNLTKTLEEFLIECVHEGTDFCLSFKEIPNPDFEKRFRQQYEQEFFKLETLSKPDSGKFDLGAGGSDVEETTLIGTSGYSSANKNNSDLSSRKSSSGNMHELIEQVLKGNSSKNEEKKYVFKPVKRLKISESKDLCFYSSNDISLFTSFETRANPNLEHDLEHSLSLRMKKYLPSNFDLIDYDRELLKKQLDLETVTVSLSHIPEKDIENDGKPYYRRDVSRMTNEDGMNMRLFMDLQKIGQEYGVNEDDLNDIFFSVSCSKSKLVEALKG